MQLLPLRKPKHVKYLFRSRIRHLGLVKTTGDSSGIRHPNNEFPEIYKLNLQSGLPFSRAHQLMASVPGGHGIFPFSSSLNNELITASLAEPPRSEALGLSHSDWPQPVPSSWQARAGHHPREGQAYPPHIRKYWRHSQGNTQLHPLNTGASSSLLTHPLEPHKRQPSVIFPEHSTTRSAQTLTRQ